MEECHLRPRPGGVKGQEVRTARQDVNLIHERLKTAQADYEVRYGKKED
jgi:hypothetical protein